MTTTHAAERAAPSGFRGQDRTPRVRATYAVQGAVASVAARHVLPEPPLAVPAVPRVREGWPRCCCSSTWRCAWSEAPRVRAPARRTRARHASAGGWGRPCRDTANVGDATAGTAAPFVTAGAFAERLRERTPFAALRESNDGRGPFRRDVRDATCDARVFGAERSSVGPLGGFLRSKTKRSEEREETSPFLGGATSPSREKAARTSERAESARRLFRPAESARPPSTDRTKPNEPLEPKEEETEGDVRGEGDADVERRRAESAVAVGDGGLLPFRCASCPATTGTAGFACSASTRARASSGTCCGRASTPGSAGTARSGFGRSRRASGGVRGASPRSTFGRGRSSRSCDDAYEVVLV